MHEKRMPAPFPTDMRKWKIIIETGLSESHFRKAPFPKSLLDCNDFHRKFCIPVMNYHCCLSSLSVFLIREFELAHET